MPRNGGGSHRPGSGATFDGLRQPSQGFFRTKHGIQFADREGFGLFQKVPPRLSSRRFPAVMLKTLISTDFQVPF